MIEASVLFVVLDEDICAVLDKQNAEVQVLVERGDVNRCVPYFVLDVDVYLCLVD